MKQPFPYGNIGKSSANVETQKNTAEQDKIYLVLRRSDDDTFPFRLGFSRARLILKHIEAIRQFLADYGSENPKGEKP